MCGIGLVGVVLGLVSLFGLLHLTLCRETQSLVAAADGMAFDGGDDSHWCGWMMLEVVFRFGES